MSFPTDSGGHKSGRGEKRSGWQGVIRRVAAGGVAGIIANDISRLARDARLVLNLHHALEMTGADLKVVQLPNTKWSSAEGRFLLGQLALTAQFQADYDSKRMTDMSRAIFQAGGHVGNDPFGYRTMRDERGAIIRPRTLEVVETEAEVARRIWRDIATTPTGEIARRLQEEGVKRRTADPWTKDAVKDILRRGRVYLGYGVYKRGQAEAIGRHPAIIDEATWAIGRNAADARRRKTDQSSRSHRVYLLTGIHVRVCGRKLHGQTRLARGRERRYYGRASIPTQAADEAILNLLRKAILPTSIIEASREELRRRLALPLRGQAAEHRQRLEGRIARLKSQYEWGDIEEGEYRAKLLEARAELALLPDPDKVVTFDAVRGRVQSLGRAIDLAEPRQLRELITMLIVSVKATEVGGFEIQPTPAADSGTHQ